MHQGVRDIGVALWSEGRLFLRWGTCAMAAAVNTVLAYLSPKNKRDSKKNCEA